MIPQGCHVLRFIAMKAVRFLAPFVFCVSLSGCGVPYLWQAASGQMQLMKSRTPIEEILNDPGRDEALQAALQRVVAMRRFAAEELGLPDNDSYTTYVELERPYVVWNVVATEEFSVDPKRWCFPFAGCVTYRGFFRQESAERYQARLDRRGFDTQIVGAGAYSTLGFFADPVLSTMIGGSEEAVAATLFHELAHQKLYIKGDSGLSEAFASAVEEYGTQRWLVAQGNQQALERYRLRVAYRAGFGRLVANQQERLRAIFVRRDPPEAKRAAKAEAYRVMRQEYEALKEQWGGVTLYDPWFAQPLNNATLAAVATYQRWLPALRWRIEEVGLESFYDEVETLAALEAVERRAWLEAWLERRSAPVRLPET